MTNGAISPLPVCSLARLAIEDRCAPWILERIMREVEPYLRPAARRIAANYRAAVPDMVQEARITLWELDLGRFARDDVLHLESLVRARMIRVYYTELTGRLTAGASC